MNKTVQLIISIAIPVVIGGISGYFTTEAIDSWYIYLQKPSFNPPNWIFGPVWTMLYIMMGIALYLIVSKPKSEQRRKAIILFGIQLFLNFWWSLIFFYYKMIGLALVDIVILWIFILLTILAFRKLEVKAAWLLVPYILWVSFATLLNASIYHLNG